MTPTLDVRLDPAQQAVVDHASGPLLVLAGPGTGKTTTLVEAVVARVESGVDPERVLVLTFSRRAAAELRSRVTARLGRTTREPLARTFHSYCFAVLRREAVERGEPVPRLLSGPEQDLVVRELLRGEVEGDGPPSGWPAPLRPALLTHGFAQELRDLLLRCSERGVDADALARLARRAGREDWAAAARFLRQYRAVSALALGPAYDPAELVRAVVDRMADERTGLLARERAAYDWVVVDEYQDTDPGQEQLLRLLRPAGSNVVAVGDPLQSVYGFRGADVRGIGRFPDRFRTADGTPAPVRRLEVSRRSRPRVLAVAAAVAATARGTARGSVPRASVTEGEPGTVRVLVAATRSEEANLVAATLRRAHLLDGVPWSAMAVLVRSTRTSLPVLRRSLSAVGVPVAVADEDLPLGTASAVRPLLMLLRCAVQPDALTPDVALALLTGPLGRTDALALRRLRRVLRQRLLEDPASPPPGDLLVEVLTRPDVLDAAVQAVPTAATGARRVARLLALAAAAATEPGATAESVLWEVWAATGLAARWQAASLAGGPRGAAADRDLDAVMALFEAAGSFTDRLPSAGPLLFLDAVEGQQVPGDSRAPRAPSPEAVRVLTAHAAKGLEWDVVVVAGVQEGAWPDVRARGSLLGTDRLVGLLEAVPAPRGPLPVLGSGAAAALEEERRLFYVAVTRARRQLVVTAVDDPDEGLVPSRFLDLVPVPGDEVDLPAAPLGHVSDEASEGASLGELRRRLPVASFAAVLRSAVRSGELSEPARRRVVSELRACEELDRGLDLASTVAELRAALVDASSSEGLREAAAESLAALAAAGVPGADPAEWYAAEGLSDQRPLTDPGGVVRVSPSRVESFTTCPLRWLLESHGGGRPPAPAQQVGTLVHELAALAATDDAFDPARHGSGPLLEELERRWPTLELGAPWYREQQLERAREMVRRLASWTAGRARAGFELVGAELDFDVELPAGEHTARVSGRVDRLERDPQGRGVVVDLKTGSRKPTKAQVVEHPQLGAYQAAVEGGAFPGVSSSGGASLVQLGPAASAAGASEQGQRPLAEADDPGWAHQLLLASASGMAGASFPARENTMCDRCPVRTSCPLHDDGRSVVAGASGGPQAPAGPGVPS